MTRQKATLGPKDPVTLAQISDVAALYNGIGQNARAVKMFEELLPLQEAVSGPGDPRTLQTQWLYGAALKDAGRLATDPPNGLFQGETVMIAGTGAQTATQSRWGDYSSLSVDPADDCTFWFTTQYYTAASAANSFGWVTGIGRFTFPSCTPIATGPVRCHEV